MEYTEKIIASINRLMESQGSAIISISNSVFALDSDLHFGEVWSIPRAKLILPDQFRRVIALIIEDGPSWIHANLISTSDHKSLITIKHGALTGNPNPQLNVSIEPHNVVKILE